MTLLIVSVASGIGSLPFTWGLLTLFEYLNERPKAQMRRIRKARDSQIAEINRMSRTAHEQIRDIGKDRIS